MLLSDEWNGWKGGITNSDPLFWGKDIELVVIFGTLTTFPRMEWDEGRAITPFRVNTTLDVIWVDHAPLVDKNGGKIQGKVWATNGDFVDSVYEMVKESIFS